MAPGSAVGGRAGPRAFVASPSSSTGDSSSGRVPLTPRDGSEAGGRYVASALGPAGEEARRKERRRSEAKASVELGNVINGPGPYDDDEEGEHMSAHHAQMGGMGMMGWGQQGMFPQMNGFQGFPNSQSMPSMSFPGQFTASQSMPFIPPPPPPGASEQFVAAHQQAMMMAKQAYLSAVAQQAMAFATEQWERSSNAGGSVYGGSQMGGGMMGMPMMGMYANSAYAASMYEGSVIGGGGGGGWSSASAYGGGARSVYGGGGAKSEYGGGMKSSPTKSNAGGLSRTRLRAQTTTAEVPPPANRNGHPVPPSTWTTRRKGGPP
ncbi:hypothetical protein FRC07_000868 [Ceratobasidium sp. 392]|nr:hypothetical protein FRC07_000868 [Ceratobasidium sp. 392]